MQNIRVYPSCPRPPVPPSFHRYGHTKIVKEFGAPPTAAQLGGAGPPQMGTAGAGGVYMAGPSMSLPGPPPNNSGYAQQQPQPRPQYGMMPQQQQQAPGGGQGHYGQPFGAPPPPAAPQGYHQASRPSNVGVSGAPSSGGGGAPLPTPGGYAYPPPAAGAGGGGAGPSPPPPAGGGRGVGAGGYGGAFNPTTTVVAADSTSSAVL